MDYILIGAGRLALHLGLAMQRAGHNCIQVYSRTLKSAEALSSKLSCAPTKNLAEIITAPLYIFSVKDDALEEVIRGIPEIPSSVVCVHTAGSMDMDLFKGRCDHYGVLYPMQTFSLGQEVDFEELTLFIEANTPKALSLIRSVASSLSKNVQILSSEKRKYLHLAAVFACNFTNHCYGLAYELLAESGISFDCMLPLIDETARKVHHMTPAEAQTGPAVRFDQSVMERHMQLLDGKKMMAELYHLLSESIYLCHEKNGKR